MFVNVRSEDRHSECQLSEQTFQCHQLFLTESLRVYTRTFQEVSINSLLEVKRLPKTTCWKVLVCIYIYTDDMPGVTSHGVTGGSFFPHPGAVDVTRALRLPSWIAPC